MSQEYAEMVTALAKPGAVILEQLTADDVHLLHMAVGVSGEAGELLDAIKKAVVYRKALDVANVIEELGDIEFYLEGLRQGLRIGRPQTIAANVEKLGRRYTGHVYSDDAAQARADKAEGQELPGTVEPIAWLVPAGNGYKAQVRLSWTYAKQAAEKSGTTPLPLYPHPPSA